MEDKISMMPTTALHTATPFKTLFPIKETVLNEIADDMKKNGFDYAHPIIIWAGHKVTVVDGHTRLAAAQKIHLNKVPVTLKEFADEEEALRYAIKSQSHRRNLTAEELLNCLTELDKRKTAGRPGKLAVNPANSGKSAQVTADLLGISRNKVEQLRTINAHAPEKIKEAVSSGKMSIDRGYRETIKDRKKKAAIENPVSEMDADTVRKQRLDIFKRAIGKMFVDYFESETQKYPEICYSATEKKQLWEELSAVFQQTITTILPGEENE